MSFRKIKIISRKPSLGIVIAQDARTSRDKEAMLVSGKGITKTIGTLNCILLD